MVAHTLAVDIEFIVAKSANGCGRADGFLLYRQFPPKQNRGSVRGVNRTRLTPIPVAQRDALARGGSWTRPDPAAFPVFFAQKPHCPKRWLAPCAGLAVAVPYHGFPITFHRSEERRVGKEGR